MLQKLELPKGFQRNVLKMEGQGSGVVGDRRGGFVRRGIEMKQDPMALVSCVLHLCFVCGKKKKSSQCINLIREMRKWRSRDKSCQTGQNNK